MMQHKICANVLATYKRLPASLSIDALLQHEEIMGLITDTLSLKPTVSAIICENYKTSSLHFSPYVPQFSILSDRNLA